jgi:hypothetical protein
MNMTMIAHHMKSATQSSSGSRGSSNRSKARRSGIGLVLSGAGRTGEPGELAVDGDGRARCGNDHAGGEADVGKHAARSGGCSEPQLRNDATARDAPAGEWSGAAGAQCAVPLASAAIQPRSGGSSKIQCRCRSSTEAMSCRCIA